MNRSYSRIGDPDFNLYKDCKYSSHYKILNHESFEQNDLPYNPNTLFFKNNRLNMKLEKALKIDSFTKVSLSGEFKYNLIVFYIFVNIFILIFALFVILMYFSTDLAIEILRINLIALSILFVAGNFGLYLISKNRNFVLKSRTYFIFLIGGICTYLILTPQNMLEAFFSTSLPCAGLPNILTLGCMASIARLILFDNYFSFLLLSLYVCSLHLSTHLAFSTNSVYSTLCEFSILVLFFGLNVVDSQLVDIKTRQLFWRIYQEQESSKNITKSNDLIRKNSKISLHERCQLVKSELKHVASTIMYKDLKDSIKKALANLDFIQKNLDATEENMFEIDRDSEMDEDDKQFIFQNYAKRDEVKMTRRDAKSMTIMDVPQKYFEFTFSPYGVNELESAFNTLGKNWTFDIWFVHNVTNHSVYIMGKYLFQKYNLSEFLKITEEMQDNFFLSLESLYKGNPYHNACHAGDVCHSLMYFTFQSDLCKSLNALESATSIIAALGHDIGHPGLTNRFIVNNRENLAIQYNDISVLENMHCSSIFLILDQPGKNIFINLSNEDWFIMRKLMIYMILETDMSRHFEILGKFKSKANNLNISNAEDKLIILGMGLKCSDIGHSAKSTDLHEKWTQLVCEEFFLQGDIEKQRKQVVSMYCDRENTDIAKSQAGFIKNICLPLYDVWCNYLNSDVIFNSCLKQLEKNFKHWDDKFKQRKTSAQVETVVEVQPLKFSASALELPSN